MLSLRGRRCTGVIFDIDGTLVDSFPVFFAVFNEGIGRYDVKPVTRESLSGYLKEGADFFEILRKTFPPGTAEGLIKKCRKEISDHFWEIEKDEVKLLPGAHEVLSYLKERQIRIGVATGRTSLPETEWERFRLFGLDRFIDALVTSKEVERRKPAPDALIECAKRLGVPIENCLVVGDTVSDIVAAKTAGAFAVAVLTGQEERELLERAQPDLIVSNLMELFSLLIHDQERQEEIPQGSSFRG